MRVLHFRRAIAFIAAALVISPLLAPCQSIGLTEILGRPTASSVTISALFDQQVEVFFQYGATPGQYSRSTVAMTSTTGEPVVALLDSLLPNTRYYYRTNYKKPSDATFSVGEEHSFHTQRPRGASFTFTVEADPHPYDKKGSHGLWPITLRNMLADSGDFMLDLGDVFGDDHEPFTITSDALRQLHLDNRAFFDVACHSTPLFLCLGNHEGESGYYLLQTPPNNIAVNGTRWRKFYYPNPEPNGFYSGNTTVEDYGVGLPQNYYAWEWGDALFVVLDAYRGYTANAKPRGWDWTLGKDQYDWLKRTLEQSTAKYKFVFAHHTLGETRGGVATAKFFEWGGYEADGRNWGFTTNRPGWAMPIHQLMKENGVTMFIQGHDHLYAKESLDGIVYQEVPMPSDSTYEIGMLANADAYTDVKLDGAGHVRIRVTPDSVGVDYVQSCLPKDADSARQNRRVAYTYSARPRTTAVASPAQLPTLATLGQNFPNPVSTSTTIAYQLPAAGHAVIRVLDVLGRAVETLVDQQTGEGTHLVNWNALNVPAGEYFCQLQVNGYSDRRRMTVVK